MNTELDAHNLGISIIHKIEAQGFAARFAGGSVRDRLLGKIPHDYDIATDATPEQICSIFTQKTHKVIPTGLDHGTVTVVYRTIPFEITTLRIDVQTDGRHAEVAFGKSFEEDAQRRDFTVNAMFEDAGGTVYDFFGGKEDLAAGRLRFVGEPAQRIKEDYLRILRYFRFWAKLKFSPDKSALSAITAHKAGLAQISTERITSELTRMLKEGAAALPPLTAMADAGVFAVIFGSEDDATIRSGIATIDQFGGTQHDKAHLILLALLISHSAQKSDILSQRLRLANAEVRLITHLLEAAEHLAQGQASWTTSPKPSDMMDFLDLCDKAAGEKGAYLPLYHEALALLAPAGRPQLERLAELERSSLELRLSKLPVTGKDLASVGIPMDKRCGEILAQLKAAYRNGEWADKAAGLKLAERLFTGSPQ